MVYPAKNPFTVHHFPSHYQAKNGECYTPDARDNHRKPGNFDHRRLGEFPIFPETNPMKEG
jgi:hypothetical protein